VGIDPANLPGGGLLAGTFTGQIVLQNNGDTVTIPVTVTVGDAVFRQINGLSFTKMVDSSSNPLSQVITVASTGANFGLSATAVDGTGGSWLSIQYGGGCCGYSTPQTLTVTANPAINLAAGTYSAEILIQENGSGREAELVPVTLTIEPDSTTFFDEVPGQLTFSMQTGGTAPPSELVQIRNAGAGTLNFTASASTADGSSWLTLSASSGTAPYLLSVSINPAKLPGAGLIAGTYTGQVLLTTAGNTVTIPVTATVGDSVFRQLSPLNFSKTVNSTSNPMPQVITVASTDTNFGMYATAVEGTGGNWLSIQYGGGCCGYSTPQTITATVSPAVTLAAGTYTAEIIIQTNNGSEPEVVPVTLSVEPISVAYFDTLPGALTFSGQATGAAIASQPMSIRNAGPGLLNWMASTGTADGGKWLTLSNASGVAPSSITVSINPANLPSQGRVPGTYTGQILLQSVGDIVTVPVTVTIGDSVIKQPVALNFTMPYQGANPSTQSLTVASTDAVIGFYAAALTSTRGNWLSIINYNCCGPTTPYTYTIAASPASPLAPGVYTGGIYVIGNNGSDPTVIPVTLTVNSPNATAAPSFSPGGGTYDTDQSVTLSSATIDAAIYYTTNGTTPTTSSTRYTSPIPVTATQTIKAIAIAPAYAQSSPNSATYTITAPTPATPSASELLTISEATAGTTVYYTTNGTTPTSASTKYTGPISLSSNPGTWVYQFIAVSPNDKSSAVRTVSITVK
jgi:hypothetical protein